MKFLKYQNTSRYSPSDNSISINPYGRVVMGTSAGLMLPKGTSAQRPDLVWNDALVLGEEEGYFEKTEKD